MSKQLTNTTLCNLPSDIKQPNYDYANRKASIVHMGIGAFHKAHQATFTNTMMEKVEGDYRIIAVSLRSPGARDSLKQNDYLYTSVEKASGNTTCSVIASIAEVLVAPESPVAVIDILSDSKIKTVTSTVTEKGYCLLPGNIGLNFDNPDIQLDLANLDSPKTFIGYFVKACLNRMQSNIGGFDYVSCDNLPDNSQIVGNAILQFAQQVQPALADWIKSNISFCNSMVDRIVPAVTQEDIASLSEQHDYQDQALVVSEPYRQWVIEDNFTHGRPPWDLAGVQFVQDVAKYEKLKLRFLNGSHTALAYLGKVAGIEFIHQAVINPKLKPLVTSLMADMAKTLDADLDVDVTAYGKSIVDRFSNHSIKYGTQQVATDGSQKLPQRIFSPLKELLSKSDSSPAMCAVIAGWFLYLRGVDETGNGYAINDPLSEVLTHIVQNKQLTYEHRLEELIDIDGLFPVELADNDQVKDSILSFLKDFTEHGVLTTLSERF